MLNKKPKPIEEKVLADIQRQKLIGPRDKILVGVSGGADSTALLHVLNKLKTKIGFQVHVGHINHHLRKSADTDQKFVETLCLSLNLPCATEGLDLDKKITKGGSLEEIARNARFEALIRMAKKTHANKIALAHHNDDLAETVLLRILRGTGLQGLQAILPKRAINGVVFIRPFLNISRSDIETYLQKNKIKFRTDLTNTQTRFFRNKIRLKLLPLLKREYQKNIAYLLGALSLTCGHDYDYLRSEASKIFCSLAQKQKASLTIPLIKFQKLHTALQRMVLRLAVETLAGNTRKLSLSHFLDLDDLITHRPPGAVLELPNGLRATKTKTSLLMRRV